MLVHVAASVALSTQLLSIEEKQMLTLCCLFPDPFYGQRWMDLESFVDSAWSSRTRLSELNLIDLDTDGGKGFSILSPIRDIVMKLQRKDNVVMQCALIHALDYYLKIVKQIDSLDPSNA
jgi:hypothetical protein